MNYLLVEPGLPGNAYNIALMKWARWCEDNNINYEYVRGLVKPKIKPDKILMSCVFTFYSKKYEQTIDYYLKMFPEAKFLVGGVFPTLNPEWFDKPKWDALPFFGSQEKKVEVHRGIHEDIEHLVPKYNANIIDEDSFKANSTRKKVDYRRKKIPLYASRGCVNKCGYCVVPMLEGKMRSFPSIKDTLEIGRRELPNATSVVLYDNNFTEHEYLDNIVDELVECGLPVDIHGLHVDSFTEKVAKKLSQIEWASQSGKMPYIRFSFDKLKYEEGFYKAFKLVNKHNIKANMFGYLLYNWTDSPEDFWGRIVRTLRMVEAENKGIWLFPQRFEPLKALHKKGYIGKHWDEEMLLGVGRLLNWTHGFLAITPSKFFFRWVGYNKSEFFETLQRLAKDRNDRPPRREGDIPKITMD